MLSFEDSSRRTLESQHHYVFFTFVDSGLKVPKGFSMFQPWSEFPSWRSRWSRRSLRVSPVWKWLALDGGVQEQTASRFLLAKGAISLWPLFLFTCRLSFKRLDHTITPTHVDLHWIFSPATRFQSFKCSVFERLELAHACPLFPCFLYGAVCWWQACCMLQLQ